jgi:hypothetical protein
MSCFICAHFHRDANQVKAFIRPATDPSLDYVERTRREEGWCTLQPVWIKVTALHFCGQFHSSRPDAFGEWWRGSWEHRAETERLRKRAIQAEAKLKALRKRKQ